MQFFSPFDQMCKRGLLCTTEKSKKAFNIIQDFFDRNLLTSFSTYCCLQKREFMQIICAQCCKDVNSNFYIEIIIPYFDFFILYGLLGSTQSITQGSAAQFCKGGPVRKTQKRELQQAAQVCVEFSIWNFPVRGGGYILGHVIGNRFR